MLVIFAADKSLNTIHLNVNKLVSYTGAEPHDGPSQLELPPHPVVTFSMLPTQQIRFTYPYYPSPLNFFKEN